MTLVPAGSFEMGDHHGFVDPKHGGDETPIHAVRVDAFFIGTFPVMTQEFCDFLNAAAARGQIEVRDAVSLAQRRATAVGRASASASN